MDQVTLGGKIKADNQHLHLIEAAPSEVNGLESESGLVR